MPAYHDVGQFYWLRVASFLQSRKIWGAHTIPLIVPEWLVQDIDTEDDWILAETKYKVMQESPPKNWTLK